LKTTALVDFSLSKYAIPGLDNSSVEINLQETVDVELLADGEDHFVTTGVVDLVVRQGVIR